MSQVLVILLTTCHDIQLHLRSEESAKETELFINAAVQSRLPDALTMTELENAAKRDPEMPELKLAITQG